MKKPPTMPKLQGSSSGSADVSAFMVHQSKVPKVPLKKSKEKLEPAQEIPEEPSEAKEVIVKQDRQNEGKGKKPVTIIHVNVGPP